LLTYADLPKAFNLTSHILDQNIESGKGDRTALYCGGDPYTYQYVASLTNQAGHVLQQLGVEMEDRVLLTLCDGVEFVAIWFAVLKVGATVAEAYTFLQPHNYEYYLNYSRAKVVVVDATTLPKVRSIVPNCPHLKKILVVGKVDSLQSGEVSFDELVTEMPDTLEPAPTTKDDIGLWKFTTGTTGDPKAAVHCHHDPVISCESYGKGVLGMTEDDIVLPIPKLFFGYARDMTALFNFSVGGAGVIFPERTTADRIFHLIQQHRPTILVNVPTMMNEMVHHPQAGDYDLSCLRLCVSSGEALPHDLYSAWHDTFGVEVLEGIGSSEAYHIYISNRQGAGRPGSAGQVVPGYEAVVVDEDGKPLPFGDAGELWVKGESTALLYWNDHEKSKRTFAGDWIHTGDMFRMDADGYFWYQGRADDLIKVGGIWVSPLEIEECLREHPQVRDCVVVGVEQNGLMFPRAYVVPKKPMDATEAFADVLKQYSKSECSPHKYPRDVWFLEEMPKTATGKVDRKTLRTGMEEGED
jgi:benzoate-CoA ligase family protein